MILLISPEILEVPVSMTVYLDQLAVFTCKTDASLSNWVMNGLLLEDFSPEIRSDTSTVSGNTYLTLTIAARAKFNETTVQCIIFGSSSSSLVKSPNVTLAIQGMTISACPTCLEGLFG